MKATVAYMGNPRGPEEAQSAYYLVPKGMRLRYPPQYADFQTDSLGEAEILRRTLKARGLKYRIYNRDGFRISYRKEKP